VPAAGSSVTLGSAPPDPIDSTPDLGALLGAPAGRTRTTTRRCRSRRSSRPPTRPRLRSASGRSSCRSPTWCRRRRSSASRRCRRPARPTARPTSACSARRPRLDRVYPGAADPAGEPVPQQPVVRVRSARRGEVVQPVAADPEPDELGSKGDFGTLPPSPDAYRGGASFDFGSSFADFDLGSVPAPPPVPPAPGESKVGLGDLGPVLPAPGWLDSAPPVAAPGAPGAEESSDIFAGRGAKAADPGENSDVLAATSGAPPRPSDAPLAFNDPPTGAADLDLADLAEAEPFDDVELVDAEPVPAGDSESIHGAPRAGPADALFDSATLAPRDRRAGLRGRPAGRPGRVQHPRRAEHPGPVPGRRVVGAGGGTGRQRHPVRRAGRRGCSNSPRGRAAPAGLFDDAEPTARRRRTGGRRGRADDVAAFSDHPDPDVTVATPAARAAQLGRLRAARGPPRRTPGQVDFDAVELTDARPAHPAAPAGSLSAILRGELPDDSEELGRTAPTRVAPNQDDVTREPVASVDYLSESNEEAALPAPRPTPGAGPAAQAGGEGEVEEGPPRRLRGADRGAGQAEDQDREGRPSRRGARRAGPSPARWSGAWPPAPRSPAAYFGGAIPNAEKGAPAPGGSGTPPARLPGGRPAPRGRGVQPGGSRSRWARGRRRSSTSRRTSRRT
jgi:hypothetical protein